MSLPSDYLITMIRKYMPATNVNRDYPETVQIYELPKRSSIHDMHVQYVNVS